MKFFILLLLFLSIEVFATGPRITSSFISPDAQEIFALDLAPFISTDVKEGGILSEVVKHIAKEEGINLLITIVPLQSILKYYLTQENALGVMGRHLGLNTQDKTSLIEIPLFLANEKFVSYKSKHIKIINYKGELSSLNGLTYGASKGESTNTYKNLGINIKKGRALSLFKKLKSENVDFISLPTQSTSWYIEKNFSDDKYNFKTMRQSSKKVAISLYFNTNHPEGKNSAKLVKKGLLKILNNGKYADILKPYVKDTNEINAQIKYIKKFL